MPGKAVPTDDNRTSPKADADRPFRVARRPSISEALRNQRTPHAGIQRPAHEPFSELEDEQP